jgi:hydroxymethylglutaryl-CoA synthase
MHTPTVGIDALSIALPSLYFPIRDLASLRSLEYDKLLHGLGLHRMAVPDADEDVVTLAAKAVIDLLNHSGEKPENIGRLYLGTESAVDGAKPTATYLLSLLEKVYGPGSFEHCDVVDLTFACIGAVDALQNCCDWAQADVNRKAVVVASDTARYRQGSGGEYTQGAGAAAMLVKQQPRLIALGTNWGVSTSGVHDFFKPHRPLPKSELLTAVAQAAQIEFGAEQVMAALTGPAKDWLGDADAVLYRHDDTPVFDGQYSNACYQERMEAALLRWAQLNDTQAETALLDRWEALIFHLPYAFQGKRMLAGVLHQLLEKSGTLAKLFPGEQPDEKSFAKTDWYKAFAAQKMEAAHRASSDAGNLYTASIFLSLASWLEANASKGTKGRLGFLAYGSGAKSKVFEGHLVAGWEQYWPKGTLSTQLEHRMAIDAVTYQKLHAGALIEAVISSKAFSFAGHGSDGRRIYIYSAPEGD